jgi:hypothetical protein
MTTDLTATDTAAALTASEWDELVCAADGAEHTVDLSASIYDSIKHWIEAVLPLHERMIRERLKAEAAVHAAELAEAREKVRICEQQTARIDREQQRLGEEQLKQIDRDLSDVIDERDSREALLDRFAAAVAPEEVIGEHSSGNCPWENALDLITPAAEVDALRQENQRLRKENDDLTEGLGLADGPRRRQLNDVIDVEPALSAALTRREA